MIKSNLITCSLCQNYFSDPRQIPCSHSFCFDCISGRFDDETFILICPKCDKVHRYNSRTEFENRCMRDGFLSSMVAQYKKSQSRLSAISSGLLSRPNSSMSHITPVSIRSIGHERNLSYTERFRSSSVLAKPLNRLFIAKCQSCNRKDELIICSHCDNVICIRCANEHQNSQNNEIKNEWNKCKTKFQSINEKSKCFDMNYEQIEIRTHQIQRFLTDQADLLIQIVKKHKNSYLDLIEEHRRTSKSLFSSEQLIDEYKSIDKRFNDLLKLNYITNEKLNDFSFEIEHFETCLNNLNKQLYSNDLKFPILTLPEPIDISSIFGQLNFVSYDLLEQNSRSDGNDDDDYVLVEKENYETNKIIPKKTLLWQLDYKSVPYYIRSYSNQLFICDKYGYLSVYKLNKCNDFRQRPIFQRDIKLFNDNSLSDDDQTIIDSFVIHKLWIIILKRKKNELYGTIYLFTHDGKFISNGKILHNYPSRELTFDIENNFLWSLDQKQLCLYYYQLPEQNNYLNKFDDYFQNRYLHVQFPKTFSPKHISVNKHVLAVLDKNRQAVHVYDKRTKQKLYEHVNHFNQTTHFCWDMALFSDNSLLIKLDETNSLKTGSSKHIYLQLDKTNSYNIIGMIEETDAYGMIITSTDEILIGVRINTKGTVKCYA